MNILHLHERVMLLSLREGKSAPVTKGFALGGACLSELCLRGRLAVIPGRKALIEVVDPTPLGVAELDDCLEKVAHAKRRTRAMNWVMRFNDKSAYHRTAPGLCRRGVLHAQDVSAWLLFRCRVYRTFDPEARRRLIASLEEVVFGEPPPADTETRVLVALADASGILTFHFARKRLRKRRRRLRELASSDIVYDPVSRAVLEARS